MINLEFAELHTSLFLAGRNFGLKLDGLKFDGLELAYVALEVVKGHWETFLEAKYKGKTALIPISNVVSGTPGETKKIIHAPHLVPGKPIKAQVSSPQAHVFET